jgi:hypothetical protein
MDLRVKSFRRLTGVFLTSINECHVEVDRARRTGPLTFGDAKIIGTVPVKAPGNVREPFLFHFYVLYKLLIKLLIFLPKFLVALTAWVI